jgi:hypothetical protein
MQKNEKIVLQPKNFSIKGNPILKNFPLSFSFPQSFYFLQFQLNYLTVVEISVKIVFG